METENEVVTVKEEMEDEDVEIDVIANDGDVPGVTDLTSSEMTSTRGDVNESGLEGLKSENTEDSRPDTTTNPHGKWFGFLIN